MHRGLPFLALVTASGLTAQSPRSLTAADYQRAERYLSTTTTPLVSGGAVTPNWLSGDRFWYRNQVREGYEFILVDPAGRTRSRAFDHARLAAALARVTDTAVDPMRLPFTRIELSENLRVVTIEARRKRWGCDLQSYLCTQSPAPTLPRNGVLSPDGKKSVFIRDWNLWVRDLGNGQETRLTTDGSEGLRLRDGQCRMDGE